MTDLSDELVGRLIERFEAARDPDRAVPMAAYMRDQFPFLGIGTPERVALSRQAIAGLPRRDEADLIDLADTLWARDEREYQYAAVWLLRRDRRALTPAFLGTAERCITTKSWWDTVDGLAQHVVGHLVHEHRELGSLMAEWLVSENLWLARTAILHQERWGADIDPDWLFAACLRRASDPEFFLRKAVGWALRSYSYVDPDAVERFVHEHDPELAGLSKREAMKAIERERRRAG